MAETAHALIVGAGPAGLAAAGALTRAGIGYIVLERSDAVGSAWRRHYQRLHLHTSRRISGLPHWPMPDDYPQYPSRQQVVDYLEAYAEHFDIRPRFGISVTHAERRDDQWWLRSTAGDFSAPNLIVASGRTHVPKLPELPGRGSFAGRILHSSDYVTGHDFAGQKVLVVGAGNSGAEIALDLIEQGAKPWLVVRSPVHVVPRDLFGLSISEIGVQLSKLPTRWADALSAAVQHLALGDLSDWGIVAPHEGIYTQFASSGRAPWIDVGTVERIQRGEIPVVSGVEGFTETGARLRDGSELPFDAVVFATGYAPSLDYLNEPDLIDASGRPPKHGEEVRPGLFFVGFEHSARGAINGMREDALKVARALS